MKTKKFQKKTLILLLLVIFIAAGIPLFHVFSKGKEAGIEVAPGDGTILIASKLKDAGLIHSTLLFRAAARVRGADGEWQYGTYTFSSNDRYSDLIYDMTQPHSDQIQVLIPEGKQVRQIANILEKNGVCSADEFLSACTSSSFDRSYLNGVDTAGRIGGLEGYLFPDTYYFEKDSEPEAVIEKMLDRFEEKVNPEETAATAEEKGLTLDEAIILASMVESEAVTESDRKLVAGVFLNRLNSPDFPKLQSCVTVEYAKGIKKTILSREDTLYDSPYNTYMYPGLPYGPICCPGEISIQAVLHPTDNEYYYFQSDEAGQLHFAKTFKEHSQVKTDVQTGWDSGEGKAVE